MSTMKRIRHATPIAFMHLQCCCEGAAFFFREEFEKSVHHHHGDPPFFLFLGLRLYGVNHSFRTYGVYPFPLFPRKWSAPWHFCSVTPGSCDRPRKEGCHGGGVYSFFPGAVCGSAPALARSACQTEEAVKWGEELSAAKIRALQHPERRSP